MTIVCGMALAAGVMAPGQISASDVIELPPIEIRASQPLVPAAYRNTPLPRYPAAARERGLEGVVVLTVRVGADGQAGEIRVKSSSGARILDDSAVSAVKAWTFTPARRGSGSIESWVDVPVRFALTER